MPDLLDSDIVIDYLQRQPAIRLQFRGFRHDGLSISAVTHMEVLDGILSNVDSVTASVDFDEFLMFVAVLPFSRREADLCARLRADLRRRGRRTRARYLDLMIAATAMTHGLTLVTRNRDDYGDLPGLTLVRAHGDGDA
ncbi:MAG: type II toxin-antitoxin system VapC family toxin [Chloroflexia bacterium]|nr:type II toxin-antitoxin system VapC family toxin [Chloroflexia bacterium]